MNRKQDNLDYKKGYGENYANLRKKEYNHIKDFTVRELAKELLIASSTISKIEKEKNPPTVEQVKAYKNYFNVSLDYLTGETKVQNADLQLISEYTGLSEDAVKKLHYLWHKDYNDFGELNEIYLSIASNMIVHEEFENVLKLIHVTKSRRDNAGNASDTETEENVKNILNEHRDMLYSAGYLFIHKEGYDRMMKQDIKDILGKIANSIIDK